MSLSAVPAVTSLREVPARGGPGSDVSTRAAAAVGSSPAVWDRAALRQLEESPERELGMWPRHWERARERERATGTAEAFSADAVPPACASLLYASIRVIKHRKTR